LISNKTDIDIKIFTYTLVQNRHSILYITVNRGFLSESFYKKNFSLKIHSCRQQLVMAITLGTSYLIKIMLNNLFCYVLTLAYNFWFTVPILMKPCFKHWII
jgi:hypothetical protein